MRLDKWLKTARIIKRRPVANEICDQGRVKVNDRVAKAGTVLAVDDKIEIKFGQKLVVVTVLAIPAGQVSTQLAKTLYNVMSEVRLESDLDFVLDGLTDIQENKREN
jgi:ribosomal 50S subunit-recycling heat shock protein